MRTLLCFLALTLAGSPIDSSFAQSANQTPDAHQEVIGSQAKTFIFIGDSITHGGSYHVNLALFYALRFPDTHITFVNAGISGDTAAGTLARFDSDIGIHQADEASIMLGMNDVNRHLYRPKTPRPESSPEEQDQIDSAKRLSRESYLSNMQKLINRLLAAKTNVTLLSPSIYDQTAKLHTTNLFGVNDELNTYGLALQQYVKQNEIKMVDFQTPMLMINAAHQSFDDEFTIIGADRIHPEAPGHFVMSYIMLKQQFTSLNIGMIDINIAQQSGEYVGCKTSANIYMSNEMLRLECVPKGLPFPVSDEQKEALTWVPYNEDFNQFTLKISGLDTGQYSIILDNMEIDKVSAQALSKGINLASYKESSLYQQALKIKAINDKRAHAEKQLRDILQVQFSMLGDYEIKAPRSENDNNDQMKARLDEHVEQSRGKPWYEYLKNQARNYMANKNNKARYREQAFELNKQIYMSNKPKSFTLVVKRLYL